VSRLLAALALPVLIPGQGLAAPKAKEAAPVFYFPSRKGDRRGCGGGDGRRRPGRTTTIRSVVRILLYSLTAPIRRAYNPPTTP
jgi:hypothetical protein